MASVTPVVAAPSMSAASAREFERLLPKVQGRLRRYCLKLVRGRHSDAEDLVQEALLRAWKAFPSLSDTTKFNGWLIAIARNQHCDHFRGKLPPRPASEIAEEPQDFFAQISDPKRHMPTVELSPLLETLIDQLPNARQRMAFCLRLQGASHKKIAEALHANKSTVGCWMSRGFDKLRQLTEVSPD